MTPTIIEACDKAIAMACLNGKNATDREIQRFINLHVVNQGHIRVCGANVYRRRKGKWCVYGTTPHAQKQAIDAICAAQNSLATMPQAVNCPVMNIEVEMPRDEQQELIDALEHLQDLQILLPAAQRALRKVRQAALYAVEVAPC